MDIRFQGILQQPPTSAPSAYRPGAFSPKISPGLTQELSDQVVLNAPAGDISQPILDPNRLHWSANMVQPRAEELARSARFGWEQTACSGIADFASRYFTRTEFQALNSGSYHNTDHPLMVAQAVAGFAHGLGWSPERTAFMQQVALLHDADDRSQMGSQDIKTGTPARAQVTLEWMEQQKDSLCQRFGWSSEQFSEAQALIARTDFPFDDKTRKPMGTRFDGQSPLQVYQEMLQKLPPPKQAEVMRDGLALRFADQAGFYAGSFDLAVESVKGLAQELQGVGVPTDLLGSLAFTPKFLTDVGKDRQLDEKLALDIGLKADSLPGREDLLSVWDPTLAQQFRTNHAQFELLAQALSQVPPDSLDQKLESLKDSARSAYRLTTGRNPN